MKGLGTTVNRMIERTMKPKETNKDKFQVRKTMRQAAMGRDLKPWRAVQPLTRSLNQPSMPRFFMAFFSCVVASSIPIASSPLHSNCTSSGPTWLPTSSSSSTESRLFSGK